MIKARVEKLHDALTEMAPKWIAHWDEIAMYKDIRPLAPNFISYANRERTGNFLWVVARDEDKMVGYYSVGIDFGLHYSLTLEARFDIMRVDPEYRTKGVGSILINCAEEELRKRGVTVWYTGSKYNSESHEPMNRLLTKHGFEPSDLIYAKVLK